MGSRRQEGQHPRGVTVNDAGEERALPTFRESEDHTPELCFVMCRAMAFAVMKLVRVQTAIA